MADEGENVRVAVRVRPFNSREKARNAKLIIDMSGPQTKISNPDAPDEEPRVFNFDHSYWSHDGFTEDAGGLLQADMSHPSGKKFADQSVVYDDIGVGVMKNAWDGFNATLFAYGQTGSGKSFSVIGYGPNRGIVPQFCDNLYKGIDAKKAEGAAIEFEVSFSMLEIYNENVHDLLNPKAGNLKVRQHPKKGFYAEGLVETPVGSYKEIDRKMEEGTMNRTVAATQMNATSSRAHTVVGITFVQKSKNDAGEEKAKTSIINLVDLAGSERADSTGATGDRLKEGAAINQSLTSLGNVISALADQSNGKNVRIPYRDSMLTKLLKNALGGNSKTIMIAAVSPADINYDESLGTLRYADRAKQIKNKATVNEDPTAKLIRELQEENQRLKEMYATGGGGAMPSISEEDKAEMEGMSEQDKEQMRKELEDDFMAQMEENKRQMETMERAFEEKLAAARADASDSGMDDMKVKQQSVAHIANLNYDTQLSGKILHFIDTEQKTIGNQRGQCSDIVLMGPSIGEKHAEILCEGDGYYIWTTARTLVNGDPVSAEKLQLHHNDRLMFGTTQLYVFVNPKERDAAGKAYPTATYEMAQEEIAAKSGFDMNQENKSKDDMLLQEDLIEMLPAVQEANSISEELDRKRKFEVILVSPEARGELKGRTKVFVKMVDLETDHEWTWERQHFLNRKFVMQEMFTKYQDGEDWKLDEGRDPFVEDPKADVHVGTVKLWLQSLSYHIDMVEQVQITDYRGAEVGVVNVEILPCNKKGKEYTEKDDVWVDDPAELVGRDLHFLIKITSARGLPAKFTDYCARFQVYNDDMLETKRIKDTINPDWNYKHQANYTPCTEALKNYLQHSAIMLQIWGQQKPPKQKKVVDTKISMSQMQKKSQLGAAGSGSKLVDVDKVRIALELAVAKKKAEKAEQKVAQFRELVRLADSYQKQRISVKLLKDLLAAPTKDVAEKCLKLVAKEKGAGN